jgi:hypothetical protein
VWGAAETFRLDCELAWPGAKLAPGHAPDTQQPFQVITVSLSGRVPPAAFAAIVAPVPTFVVDEVSWTPSGWRMKGKAYVH